MNKILLTAADSTSGGAGSYVSPEAQVAEIYSEGVMCASVLGAQTLSVQEWEEDKSFSW